MQLSRKLVFREWRACLALFFLMTVTGFYTRKLWYTLAGKEGFRELGLLGYPSSSELASTVILICLIGGLALFLAVQLLAIIKINHLVSYLIALTFAAIFLIVITSQTVFSFLIFIFIIISGLFTAYRLLSLLHLNLSVGLERLAFGVTLTLAYFIMLVFILGVVGILTREVVIAIILLGVVLCWPERAAMIEDAKVLKGLLLTPNSQYKWLIPIVAISLAAVLISFMQAVAPDIQFDAIHIQLYVADMYAEEGKIVNLVSTDRSYIAKGANMLFALGYLFDGEVVAKLFSWLPLIVFGLYLPSFTFRYLKSAKIGVLAYGLLVTMPIVGYTAGTAYQETLTMLFVFSSIYSFLRWREEQSLGWAFLTGFLSGVAIFAKTQAVFVIAGVVIWVGVELFWRYVKTPKILIRQVGVFAASGILSGLPWYLLVYRWTKNPLFPFYNNVFRSPYYPPIHPTYNLSTFGTGHDLQSLVELPWNLTFQSGSFNEGIFGNALLGLVVIILPLWFIVPKTKQVYRVAIPLFFIAIVQILFWIYQAQYIRYLMYVFPVYAVISAHMCGQIIINFKTLRVPISILVHYIVFVGFSLSLIFTLKTWWNVPDNLPTKLIMGQQDRDEYLENTLYRAELEAYQFIRTHSRTEPLVVTSGIYSHALFGQSSRIFHLDDSNILKSFIVTHQAQPEYIARIFEYLGVTHVVLSPLFNVTLTDTFIDRYLLPVYGGAEVMVYEFYPRDKPLVNKVNIASNGNFEVSDGARPLNWFPNGSPLFVCNLDAPEGCYVEVNVSNHFYQIVSIQEKLLYELSLNVQAVDSSSQASVWIHIDWIGETNRKISTSFLPLNVSSSWRHFSLPLTAPNGAVQAIVYAVSLDEQYVAIDNISFEFSPYNTSELIQNGNFEHINNSMPVNWQDLGMPEFRCVQQTATNCYVEVNISNYFYQIVDVEAQKLYDLSLNTRATGPSSLASMRLQANWLDSSGNQIGIDFIIVEAGSEWLHFSLLLRPPEGSTQAVIYIVSHDNLYAAADDVSLKVYEATPTPIMSDYPRKTDPLKRWKELMDCLVLDKDCAGIVRDD